MQEKKVLGEERISSFFKQATAHKHRKHTQNKANHKQNKHRTTHACQGVFPFFVLVLWAVCSCRCFTAFGKCLDAKHRKTTKQRLKLLSREEVCQRLRCVQFDIVNALDFKSKDCRFDAFQLHLTQTGVLISCVQFCCMWLGQTQSRQMHDPTALRGRRTQGKERKRSTIQRNPAPFVLCCAGGCS